MRYHAASRGPWGTGSGLQVMADDFTKSSTLRGLEWDAAQVRLKERWSAKVHVECEGVSALQAFLVVLCESSAE